MGKEPVYGGDRPVDYITGAACGSTISKGIDSA